MGTHVAAVSGTGGAGAWAGGAGRLMRAGWHDLGGLSFIAFD